MKARMREIDLDTGKYKTVAPLKDALDYRRWDQIAVGTLLCTSWHKLLACRTARMPPHATR